MSRRRPISALLSSIRYDEVSLLQGSPLIGAALSIQPITVEKLGMLAVFATASAMLVAHIFSFNDWAEIVHDGNGPSRSKILFHRKGISPRLLLLFSLLLLVASLLILAVLELRLFVLGAAIAALGIFYSHPRLNAKSTPIVSSFPHFAGGMLHFLLGYALFTQIDRRGVLIAVFFALSFTAGHLNHEVHDYELDQQNQLSTNAVLFGKRPTFVASLALFTLAYAYFFFLAWSGLLPRPMVILPIAFNLLHLFWSARTLRDGLTSDNVSRFQARYRLLYLIIGVSILVACVSR